MTPAGADAVISPDESTVKLAFAVPNSTARTRSNPAPSIATAVPRDPTSGWTPSTNSGSAADAGAADAAQAPAPAASASATSHARPRASAARAANVSSPDIRPP